MISWTLPTNAGESMVVILALLAGLAPPVTAVQILWINLITGVTLGLALAFEPTETGTMSRPPRARNAPILSGGLVWHVVLVATLFLAAVFGIFTYAIDKGYTLDLAQTMAMNAGCATFWHYTIIHRLHERGQVDDGFMLEFLKSHTNVIYQPAFDSRGYGGINPYALGFAMFSDLRRICERPTPEDSAWFPGLAGSDWHGALDFAMRNFKDESFIAQYLSPRLMREFHLFAIADHAGEHALAVDSIHDERGYRRVRKLLAQQHAQEYRVPDVQVVRFDRGGDRSLTLRHIRRRARPLNDAAAAVVVHLRRLWGFPVRLETWEDDARVDSVPELAA